MFAGKTSELKRILERYLITGLKPCVIKYKNDKRYDKDYVFTHNQQKIELETFLALSLFEIKEQTKSFDIIGIDEAQFFKDLIPFINFLVSTLKKCVVITCLNGDSEQEPWEDISYLFSKAEKITYLSAICYNCKEDANFTICIVKKLEKEMIGVNNYKAVCRNCLEKTQK